MEELAEHPDDEKQEWGLTAELMRTPVQATGSEAEYLSDVFIGTGEI